MKKCPNCGCEEFFVTAHVTQDWLVDKCGDFMQVENECVEVTHQPNDEDLWQCADCGYDAAGEKFEVEDEEEKEMKKYTLKEWKEFCEDALIMPPFEDDEQIEEWFNTHKIHISSNDCVMELEYDADAVNEIEFSLKEIYEAIHGGGNPTTGNTTGSEYPNATWKDILRFAALHYHYEGMSLKEAIKKCIQGLRRREFEEIMKEIDSRPSANLEFMVNFSKLDTRDFWKIFDEEERRQAFKEILCSKIEIEELYDKDGRCADKVVITDYSIKMSGDLVGWHYGVDWDKDSEDNQGYINDYIEEMLG